MIHVCTCMYMYMYACVCVYVRTCTYVFTYVCTCMCIYMYTCIFCVLFLLRNMRWKDWKVRERVICCTSTQSQPAQYERSVVCVVCRVYDSDQEEIYSSRTLWVGKE